MGALAPVGLLELVVEAGLIGPPGIDLGVFLGVPVTPGGDCLAIVFLNGNRLRHRIVGQVLYDYGDL